MQLTNEALALTVALRLDSHDPARCAAWMEAADRVCNRDAARPWLCKRHETVAHRRAGKLIAEATERAEKARQKREEERPALRERLARVEAKLDRLDPFRSEDRPDRAAACAPLSKRLPSDSRISELARLHEEAARLRDRLGE